mgnify:CR=1 FL=1
MNLKLRYFMNKKLRQHSEKVFEGISMGRKKALENWFNDKWVQIETIKDSIITFKTVEEVYLYLKNEVEKYEEFCEIYILNEEGKVFISSFEKHINIDMSDSENFKKGLDGKKLMYGPYEDKLTLDLNLKNKKFSDEVTLMFSSPYKNEEGKRRVICFRVLNDDMSNVIQDEDTHIYKDSGDNYLFMIKNSRGIKPGTAISRSRFEDDTFTLGENLKDGVKTNGFGTVKVNNHTEFEVIFTDPAKKDLHEGVTNTIKNGENLNCWPGYPDYRHIMVGGKGTIINPPNSDEIWGMMCEGDIAEIYNFKSINIKIPIRISFVAAAFILMNQVIISKFPQYNILFPFLMWFGITMHTFLVCRKMVVLPLGKTIDILQDIAEGEGNLAKRVDKISTDEIGELSRWFNKFVNNQMSMLKRVKMSAKNTDKSVKVVTNISNEVRNGMAVIQDTVVSLLKNSKSQNKNFQDTKERFEEISASIQEMDSLIIDVAGVVDKTSDNSKEIKEKSEEVLRVMKDLSENIKDTADTIHILKDNSLKVNEVINVINKISKQTQILALNASIEAARAGESGRGFSVVAEEITKLAIETEEATKSIAEVIKDLNNQTDSVVIYSQKINEKVDISRERVEESIEGFNNIDKDMIGISASMRSISEITSSQSENIGKATNVITAMAGQVYEATADNSDKSEESLMVVNDILDNIINLKQSIELLKYSSGNLNNIVEGFKFK